MTHDRVRVELRHPRRAHHDGRRADVERLPAVGDAGARPLGRRARDDADASVDLLDDDLEDPAALGVVEPRDLARHAERGHAVHAGADEQIHDASKARFVHIAVRLEGSREDGVDAFELQLRVSNWRAGCRAEALRDFAVGLWITMAGNENIKNTNGEIETGR